MRDARRLTHPRHLNALREPLVAHRAGLPVDGPEVTPLRADGSGNPGPLSHETGRPSAAPRAQNGNGTASSHRPQSPRSSSADDSGDSPAARPPGRKPLRSAIAWRLRPRHHSPVSSATSSEAAGVAIAADPTRRRNQSRMSPAVGTTMPNRSEIPARLAA